jgi:hypothetical protein
MVSSVEKKGSRNDNKESIQILSRKKMRKTANLEQKRSTACTAPAPEEFHPGALPPWATLKPVSACLLFLQPPNDSRNDSFRPRLIEGDEKGVSVRIHVLQPASAEAFAFEVRQGNHGTSCGAGLAFDYSLRLASFLP